jgi:hypothetical protein
MVFRNQHFTELDLSYGAFLTSAIAMLVVQAGVRRFIG